MSNQDRWLKKIDAVCDAVIHIAKSSNDSGLSPRLGESVGYSCDLTKVATDLCRAMKVIYEFECSTSTSSQQLSQSHPASELDLPG